MERFIEMLSLHFEERAYHLKSSMERFIAQSMYTLLRNARNLKSSMERFIDTPHPNVFSVVKI